MDNLPLEKENREGILIFPLILLGGILRLIPVISSDFPLNDGGMFLVMVRDLLDNNFRLPIFTSYNHANIPFAYPPLAFYVVAMIHKLTGIELTQLFQYVPFLFCTISIPIFYSLTKCFLETSSSRFFAVLAYALNPTAFTWLLMGGGITRTLGVIFSLFALISIKRYLNTNKNQHIFTGIIFSSLTIYSHPEMAWFLAYSILLMVMYQFNMRNILPLIGAGVGILVLIFPWLLILWRNHGFVLSLPFSGGGTTLGTLLSQFFIMLSGYNLAVQIWLMFGLVGLLICLVQRKSFIPIWLLTVVFLQLRGVDQRAVIPLCLLGGIGLEAIKEFIQEKAVTERRANISFGILTIILIFQSFLAFPTKLYNLLIPISKSERAAMSWMQKNLQPGSAVLVITAAEWYSDKSSEWLPALSGHTSVGVVQGYEWLGEFSQRLDIHDEINLCSSQNSDCIEELIQRRNLKVDYLYVPKECRVMGNSEINMCRGGQFVDSSDPQYRLVADLDGVVIYQRVRN